MKAIKDLWYMITIWMIMRVSPWTAGELLERFGKVLQSRKRK